MALRDLSLRPPVEPLDCTPATAGQQLASRGEYRPCRKDFPDWQAERFAGTPYDDFVLRANDVLGSQDG
jgi:hypothetical protein